MLLHAEQARPIGSGSATRDLWLIIDHQGPIEKRVRDHVTEFKLTARAIHVSSLFSMKTSCGDKEKYIIS